MIAPIIILGLLFVSYIAYMKIRYGETDSISQTSVLLPEKEKILFTVWCWGMGLTFPYIDLWLIPTALSLFIMGVTVHWNKYATTLHVVSASAIYLTALIYLGWMYFPLGLIPTALSIITFFALKPKGKQITNYTYWLEIILFGIIYMGLGLIAIITN